MEGRSTGEERAEDEALGVLALVTDMISASRIQGAARATGVAVDLIRNEEALGASVQESRPGAIFVDLQVRGIDVPATIRRLKADPATESVPVVVFGPHVEGEALRAARSAGADRVLARSAFVRQLPDLLREFTVGDSASPA